MTIIKPTNLNSQQAREKVISTGTEIALNPAFDYKKKTMILENGSPKQIMGVEAIRQWIILFIITPKNTYKIYDGTGFGTSIRKLFGRKTLNNGYEEAEVEREIRDGLPLCPAINRVTSYNMTHVGKIVKIYVQVELYDGNLIEETVDVSFLIK